MAQTRLFETSSLPVDVRRVLQDDQRHILALFDLYLSSPPDSRQAIVEQILHQLVSHLEREEDLLFQEIRRSGPQGRKLVGTAELEHEEVKTVIRQLQQSEADDDQALDEFFEHLMETVRAHFVREERDLFPLADH